MRRIEGDNGLESLEEKGGMDTRPGGKVYRANGTEIRWDRPSLLTLRKDWKICKLKAVIS